MSKVKRILSVIMAMVMVLAMSVPTFAAGENATITLKSFLIEDIDLVQNIPQNQKQQQLNSLENSIMKSGK